MPPALVAFDAPLPPSEFRGREQAVKIICDRLLNSERQSTSVVGGPRTGKTSLLRYLASPFADKYLHGLSYRIYIDAQLLSSSAKPAEFWLQVLLPLREKVTAESDLVNLISKKITDAQLRSLDN